jgi:hypothetical protein
MNSTTLKLLAVPLGAVAVGAASYFLFAAPERINVLAQNERGVLTCNEYLSPKVRAQAKADGRNMKARKRYASVSRVVACASPDGGQCNDETDALIFFGDTTEREVVGTGRCILEPCDERCDTPKRLSIAVSPCVIPRCENDAGEYDESVPPSDCRRRSKNLEGNFETRWFGCNVFPASEAVGTECEPAACEVWSGSSGAEL